MKFSHLIVVALFIFSAQSVVLSSDYLDAHDAYKNGEREKAFALLKRLAELGDARAQIDVGVLYRDGLGVQKDLSTSEAWFRKARTALIKQSKRGDSTAQLFLGGMYKNGTGVPKSVIHQFAQFVVCHLIS